MPIAKEPTLTLNPGAAKGPSVAAGGTWQVHALAQGKTMATITALIKTLKADNIKWDLTAIDSMDHIGAQLLWNAWGKTRPADLQLAPGQEEFFNRLETTGKLELPRARAQRLTWVMKLGFAMLLFFQHLAAFVRLIGQVTLDLGRFLRAPMRGPWKEISANIFHAGFQALGITALVGFLIGVVFSYLSAQQLRNFGGDIFLVNLLGMSIIRELGPLLAAILVAGRSGSSITAQLGVMRVTEELDAMLVMGISHGFRLIMPKVLALAIAMPLLVIWTDTIALLGGMVSAKVELNLSPQYFALKLPEAVPLANYMIGLGKGMVFGILIALVSCHFGLRIKPNTESLGRGTTTSVVTAITAVILADAVFAILFSGVGF
ncbi:MULTISPECIES: ABC transporter permease [Telluria group]|uniref:ABC transporter permease n=1 Tax=Rugamonas aquatica TaxID=2743357 RepID=A0A6A7NAX8_9BURK|nr:MULTISPECIES: ABC transporter permease [Telluria group]MQA42226.1 ABC transporter permease [Rugamonas aquatica]OEZ56247.1 putative phospholipid ABC transporter permease protein MlaE [Duganella sp. HH105]OEZ99974.1 putative phospholipid ABC transporter permease protein MlaE [Duganella sp. HH101]